MNSDSNSGGILSANQHGKWIEESAALMLKGLDMYSTMTRAWLNSGKRSPEEKPGDFMKAWVELFTDQYKRMSEMLVGDSGLPGSSIFKGKSYGEEMFTNWTRHLTGPPVDSLLFRSGMEPFIEFSKSWQNSYRRLSKAWIESLDKTATAYKSGQSKGEATDKSLKVWLESSGEFLKVWLQFADEQTKALFQFLKSSRADLISDVEKGSKKGKEEKAA